VAGGGRYDPLIEQLGGKPNTACGWGMGIERILELMKEEGLAPEVEGCDVYMVHQGDEARAQAFVLAERLRDAGLDVILHCSADGASASFKAQMKRADSSGAAYAVIIGADEVANGTASFKPLRNMALPQQSVAVDHLTERLIDAMVASAEADDADEDTGGTPNPSDTIH